MNENHSTRYIGHSMPNIRTDYLVCTAARISIHAYISRRPVTRHRSPWWTINRSNESITFIASLANVLLDLLGRPTICVEEPSAK